MPEPVYLICAESGAEDKQTDILSLFNIVERLVITPMPPVDGVVLVPPQVLRVVAVWMRNENDGPEDEFEQQMVFSPPAGAASVMTGVTPFRFEKLLHRFTVKMNIALAFAGPGMFWVETRVRRRGADEWITHRYPIVVDAEPPTPPQT
jgi:hypothetical protein